MYIAQKLREQNIAEYLLYMWQTEDRLRALDCNEQRVETEYAAQFNLPAGEMKKLTEWYGSLCRMMREEGVREKGHLQINRNVVASLEELSQQLLENAAFKRYHSVYFHALPNIMALRQKGNAATLGDIEVCFNALYGVTLLRLKGQEISPATLEGIKEISGVIGLLAAYYKKSKEGGLSLDGDSQV